MMDELGQSQVRQAVSTDDGDLDDKNGEIHDGLAWRRFGLAPVWALVARGLWLGMPGDGIVRPERTLRFPPAPFGLPCDATRPPKHLPGCIHGLVQLCLAVLHQTHCARSESLGDLTSQLPSLTRRPQRPAALIPEKLWHVSQLHYSVCFILLGLVRFERWRCRCHRLLLPLPLADDIQFTNVS